ncbi:hypothetical protein [Nocardia sp. R7R-8]|uniref:hypothetical protein n=1 Tax=Nocardia sp. R7R-8 TaxID=3459304 RepID=UPI00403E13A0
MTIDDADNTVTAAVLSLLGDSERQDREWDAGEDHAAEVEAIDAELVDMADVIASGAFAKGTPARAKLEDRVCLTGIVSTVTPQSGQCSVRGSFTHSP